MRRLTRSLFTLFSAVSLALWALGAATGAL